MLATPLGYNDNPQNTLQGLSKLSMHEAKYFATGYIHACNHVNEILTDARSKFFTIQMSTEDPQRIKKINGITKTLDLLEEALVKRTEILEQFLKEAQYAEEENI